MEQGSGPLVLLVHGFPESWYSWRRQLPALAAAGFRAAAIDVRGYGRSSHPATLPGLTASHVVEGCGHWLQQERPEETNRLLTDWLAALPG